MRKTGTGPGQPSLMSTLHEEQDFWDAHVESLDGCRRKVEGGPDPNVARAIALLEPLSGVTVLDVGCGSGVLAAWLARAGAYVTGIDVSPAQIERAVELHEALGLRSRFVAAPLSVAAVGGEKFDRLAGRYVLHHLDPPRIATDLAAFLRPEGKAAFVETVGTNPILRAARALLTGRYGIPRYGTTDERPLTPSDLHALEAAFGSLRLEVAEMQFLRIFDRQILHYRRPRASRLLSAVDDVLLRAGLARWSYHQVVLLGPTLRAQP